MTTFIEFHALRSFPPSNLNRDDLGTPKTAIFGGSRRLRISSQCLKRTWRTSDAFRGHFAAEQLGLRTDRLPEEVLGSLGTALDEKVREGLIALLASIGRKVAKEKADDDAKSKTDDDVENDQVDETARADEAPEPRTAHLLFLSRQEIEAVSDFARSHVDLLGKVYSKKKVDAKAIEKLRKELQSYLEERTSRNAVDIGLFGRFVTSDEFDTVDAALQVAHGLGTQKVEVEYDYFTAVDDLGDSTGAGHLGESEYASSVLYLYACCDLDQLERNLGRRSVEGRMPDGEARQLAKKSLPAIVRAIAEATPQGKKTGTAPYTPAEYIEVVVRHGAPMSFANAFLKPVDAREAEGDVMEASIQRLVDHRERVEASYGRNKDTIARFVLQLRGKVGSVATLEQLERELSTCLEKITREAVK
jgi:CRISPR system Cascade subunit CasC